MRLFFKLICLTFVALTLNSCVVLVPYVKKQQSLQSKNSQVKAYQVPRRSNQLYFNTSLSSYDYKKHDLNLLISDLKSGSNVERVHAAFWVGEMGAKAVKAIPYLAANLRHSNEWVRRASVKSLAKIPSRGVIKYLKSATYDRNKFVSDSAKKALRRRKYQNQIIALAK